MCTCVCMYIYIYIYTYIEREREMETERGSFDCHRDVQGPPILGPPHYKLTCTYLVLLSNMCVYIRLNKDI